jgi:hypothetical protein
LIILTTRRMLQKQTDNQAETTPQAAVSESEPESNLAASQEGRPFNLSGAKRLLSISNGADLSSPATAGDSLHLVPSTPSVARVLSNYNIVGENVTDQDRPMDIALSPDGGSELLRSNGGRISSSSLLASSPNMRLHDGFKNSSPVGKDAMEKTTIPVNSMAGP